MPGKIECADVVTVRECANQIFVAARGVTIGMRNQQLARILCAGLEIRKSHAVEGEKLALHMASLIC